MDADRGAIPRLGADCVDFLDRGRRKHTLAGGIAEGCFVDVEIAANNGEDEAAGDAFIEDGLGGFRGGDAKEIGERLDGGGIRRLDLLHRQWSFRRWAVSLELR